MSATPIDRFINAVVAHGYHNHRRQEHSDIVSEGIFADLTKQCPDLARDYETGVIGKWLNVRTDMSVQGRGRKIDLLAAGFRPDTGKPDLKETRLAIENKSIVTAHRNRTNRYSDLNDDLNVIHAHRPEAIHIATVMIGTALRVLNVPDGLNRRLTKEQFAAVLPRLSKGDQALWTEFGRDVSENTDNDIEATITRFRGLPTRHPGHTHARGYDYVLLVPVFIDNVNPPRVDRDNRFGIDVDSEYQQMIRVVCAAYGARWHLHDRVSD